MVASPIEVEVEDRPLTIDDLDAMPDDGNRYELLQGELVVSPAPGGIHQEILGILHVQLFNAVQSGKNGKVLLGPFDVQLSPNDVVEPDLFFFRLEQASQYSQRRFLGAPAFVIEIVSPSSGNIDRIRKASLYVNSGVEEYWIVEPARRLILVHDQSSGESSAHVVTAGALTSRVVPTFTVDLGALFAIVPSE
jgi:Uma2 family endonuclease